MYLLEFLNGGLLQLAWWQLILAALLLTDVTIAGVTIYLHRSQAHRAVDLHPAVGNFFRAWLWLTTGMQTREWVSIHRKHHAKCETPEDPHSPQTRGIKTVLWSGAELYMAEAENQETLTRYGHGTPNDWVERNLYSKYTWHGCGLMLDRQARLLVPAPDHQLHAGQLGQCAVEVEGRGRGCRCAAAGCCGWNVGADALTASFAPWHDRPFEAGGIVACSGVVWRLCSAPCCLPPPPMPPVAAAVFPPSSSRSRSRRLAPASSRM